MVNMITKADFVFLIILLIFWLFIVIRIHVVFHKSDVIIEAIYQYKIHCIEKRMFSEMDSIRYSDMEKVGRTLLRFWDWGYTRILPKDKFEMIKPYIK